MLGLFGSLNLGARALQVQQQALEISGHNMANVNNPAYARQRLAIQSASSIQTALGAQGTGVEAARILQMRDELIDRQIQEESSVSGSLEAQQRALRLAQTHLGQSVTAGAGEASAAAGSGNLPGLAERLDELFNAFHSVSTQPASSSERQMLISKAVQLAESFNKVDARLAEVQGGLDESIESSAASANKLLSEVAQLNQQITVAQQRSNSPPNDLLDLRQEKIEQLSRLVRISTAAQENGAINVSISGALMVSGSTQTDRIETFRDAENRLQVRAASTGETLQPGGGALHGAMEARDGAIAQLRSGLDTLAGELIRRVNEAHSQGFNPAGGTGTDFFTGTGARTIRVNPALESNPALFQASGDPNAPGDNRAALALARIATERIPALNDQTFAQHYTSTVVRFGEEAQSVQSQIARQDAIERLLQRQRGAISAVSLDEEMTDMMKFQKAFAASARLISTIDMMLETIVNLKR